MKYFITSIALYCLAVHNLVAAESFMPPPGHTRTLIAPHTANPPIIDGKIDDDLWKRAAMASNFWLSSEQKKPADSTEVLVLRDQHYLYFAFRCYDSQPGDIIANKTRRDAGLGYDDKISIELDSFRNYRTISTYSVNARGTQNDAISGGRARNIEWKGDWKGAAVRTDYGWSAEIAIPFEILNYHSESRNFGINFLRYQNRTDELSHWADVTPQSKPEEMGVLSGLELPDIAKHQPWTLMPYVLVGENIPNIKGEEDNQWAYAGADIRYEPLPNVTGVVSIYPDFSQLEEQITDIDFSYTEKYRSDPRPFFQEGSAYFGNEKNRNYFYSNRVSDFYVGGKLFSQIGNNATGGFITWAPDGRQDGAFRLMNEIDAGHSAGIMLVATQSEELDNQLAVAQVEGRETSGLFYAMDLAYSNTEKTDFDTGGTATGTLGWEGDYWTVAGSSDYYHKEYFPANGLIEEDKYGTKSLNTSLSYYREPSEGLFREVSGGVYLTGRDTLHGDTQKHSILIDGSVELLQQIRVQPSYYTARYRPVSEERGEFKDTLNHDHYWATNMEFNTRSNFYGYGTYYADGFLGGGDYQYITGYVWMKPTNNTSAKVSSERLDNFGVFDQTIVNLGWDVTPQDGFVARYINSDDGDYIRIAYRHSARAGVDYFAVFDETPFAGIQFSVKAIWSIQ